MPKVKTSQSIPRVTRGQVRLLEGITNTQQTMGLAKEVEEMKKSLDFLSEQLSTVTKQQTELMKLFREVMDLKLANAEQEKQITFLESRVADLEQYTRINDVIITGIKIKPRSYARAVTPENGGEPSEMDVMSTELQVAEFLQSKGIELDCNNIEACHPLPRKKDDNKDNPGPPAVILRFANRKFKTALLKQGKMLKGTDVFINEHLSKKNADIARKARQLKKQKKIQNTWSANCKIFIKLNGNAEEAKVICIKNIADLDKYNK